MEEGVGVVSAAVGRVGNCSGSCQEPGRKAITMKSSSVSTTGIGHLWDLISQDVNKQDLHTPQTKEKPAFRELNVNKPTSERKVSVFGKRTSAHRSWISQFGIFFSSEKIKDSKPLNDRAFIRQCMWELRELF